MLILRKSVTIFLVVAIASYSVHGAAIEKGDSEPSDARTITYGIDAFREIGDGVVESIQGVLSALNSAHQEAKNTLTGLFVSPSKTKSKKPADDTQPEPAKPVAKPTTQKTTIKKDDVKKPVTANTKPDDQKIVKKDEKDNVKQPEKKPEIIKEEIDKKKDVVTPKPEIIKEDDKKKEVVKPEIVTKISEEKVDTVGKDDKKPELVKPEITIPVLEKAEEKKPEKGILDSIITGIESITEKVADKIEEAAKPVTTTLAIEKTEEKKPEIEIPTEDKPEVISDTEKGEEVKTDVVTPEAPQDESVKPKEGEKKDAVEADSQQSAQKTEDPSGATD